MKHCVLKYCKDAIVRKAILESGNISIAQIADLLKTLTQGKLIITPPLSIGFSFWTPVKEQQYYANQIQRFFIVSCIAWSW